MRITQALAAAGLAVLLCAGSSFAQQQTGEIFGRVTDSSGAVLPGTTITVAGPALLQPRSVVASDAGSYRVPELPIGTYSVTFELAGFRRVVREEIRITIGFAAQVNGELSLSAVEETVTVTGESPIIDTRSTTQSTSFDLETLQNIPTARDPWVMLERTPAISMDRVNVGGTQSGQQSNYVSRGAATGNNKWSVDGVDITDMSATGASPIYYDFDMLQEMQVTTGGADAAQQTGGVGINFVTKSGTDRLRFNARYYLTDEELQSDNLTDEVKLGGVGGGAPIQNIKDYGFDVGGPIMRGKAWFWGSYGKQDIKAGIVGFYLPTAECQAIKSALAANPLAPIATNDVRSCLGTDGTKLNNYNWKIDFVPFANNKFGFQNTWAEKFKNARDASDLRPIETTFRQQAVPGEFGKWGWDVGPSPLWKASDQHVINDRWLVDFQWAHLGNNFVLDFNDPSLADVQPTFNIGNSAWSRSYRRSGPFIRPTNSFDLTSNYFLPGVLGGDHQLKVGYRHRTAKEHSEAHRGGNTEARFRGSLAACQSPTAGCEADLWRDSSVNYKLYTQALYVQDSWTMNRLTVNIGVRWDHQANESLPSSVSAHPFLADWLPAISFPGADGGVVWNDVSPRLGLNYDISGTGRTVAHSSFAVYYGQRSPNQAVSPLNPVTEASIRFPWTDLDGDGFVQRNELTIGRENVLNFTGNYDPDNPSQVSSSNRIDPNLKDDRTREFIIGFDHELFRSFAVGASYIWRKYDRFAWNDTIGFGSEDYVARTFTPANCVAGARCDEVTYYEPAVPIPSPFIYTNQPDRWRDYNGFELVATKRYSNRWQGTLSYAFNNAVDHWGSPAAYEDPTCRTGGGRPNITACNQTMLYAPESGGSGIDNVFNNAKWLVKATGMYTLPLWDIGLAGSYDYRQGYPFPQAVRTPTRANRAGTVDVLLDPVGDVRLPNMYIMNLRVDRAFAFDRLRVTPSVDFFNLTNVNTVLAHRRLQSASNANQISGIVAPRVIRFGIRMQW